MEVFTVGIRVIGGMRDVVGEVSGGQVMEDFEEIIK